ncbi:hypothetical protein PUR57_08135 [Streptomyces sp. JV176]|uniref:hypothetical protein n=1 Tax=Streptomyces sp. JV176 TaxID=858630 RepID=UPI002E76BB9E|nr:hypothetical protein [Streptomyces sp. JV176]MEE1798643.1 hypothetical protein [Streptomyces sp. JV176]
MEPTELVAAAVRLVASSASSGAASAVGTRVGEVITQRLGQSPQGRRALAGLESADASDDGRASEPARAAVSSALLDEVLEDPEFKRRLDEAVAEALSGAHQPVSAGQPGINIGGTRNKVKGNFSLGPLTIHNTRTNQVAALAILLVFAVAAVLIFRTSGEERVSAPLNDPAVVRTVVPDEGSVPSGWTVTEQPKAERCGGQADCAKLLGGATASWKEAELVVYAASSEGAASDLYSELRTSVSEENSATSVDVGDFGDDRSGWRHGELSEVIARSGTVLVRAASGKDAGADAEKLAQVVVERADQAQRGDTPSASMRD